MRLVRSTFTLKRVTNIAVGLAVVAMLIMLVVSFKTLNNTDAASRSDQLNGCRAEYRADIDAATATRADANDALSVLNAQIFAAAVNRDPAVVELIGRAELASRAVEAAARAAKVANDAYAAAVTSSRMDPDGFLETCKHLGGSTTTTTTTDSTTTTTTTTTTVPGAPATTASSAGATKRTTTTRPATTSTSSTTSTSTPPPDGTPPAPAPPTSGSSQSLLDQAITGICRIDPKNMICKETAQ